MSDHHYPPDSLIPDYLRSGAGLVVTGGPLLLVNPSSIMIYVLAGLAALFLLFGARTAVRHMTRFELTDNGLRAAGPFGARVPWGELEGLELRYYSTRRDRSRGWLQLKLAAAKGRLRLDSDITDFAVIAARAAREAAWRGVELSESTRANLTMLGVGVEPPPPVAADQR